VARTRVEYDDARLRKNLSNFDNTLRYNLRAIADFQALETTAWLKQNARWTDRTGAARSGLYAIPNEGRGFIEIYMAYSVWYGIWLETAHDRKYAIITPAMRIMGDALMQKLNGLLDRMQP
jgi:hypothetical protein